MFKTIVPIVLPLTLVLLWQLVSHLGWIPAALLPPPEHVLQTFRELVQSGELRTHVLVSLTRVLEGFAMGFGCGLILGAALVFSRTLDTLTQGIFQIISQIPPLALVPLLILAVGSGEIVKLLVIAKAVMIPVALSLRRGVQSVPASYRELGAALRLSRWQVLRRILLPAASPEIMTGLRYALTHAWLTLVTAELLSSSEGLGFLIVWGRQLFQMDLVMIGIVLIGVLGLLTDTVFRLLQKWILRWQPAFLGGFS